MIIYVPGVGLRIVHGFQLLGLFPVKSLSKVVTYSFQIDYFPHFSTLNFHHETT